MDLEGIWKDKHKALETIDNKSKYIYCSISKAIKYLNEVKGTPRARGSYQDRYQLAESQVELLTHNRDEQLLISYFRRVSINV